MKKLLILSVAMPIIAWIATHNETAYALLACSPVFGLGCLFWWFIRWHRGFHANRRKYGIHRAPGA